MGKEDLRRTPKERRGRDFVDLDYPLSDHTSRSPLEYRFSLGAPEPTVGVSLDVSFTEDGKEGVSEDPSDEGVGLHPPLPLPGLRPHL